MNRMFELEIKTAVTLNQVCFVDKNATFLDNCFWGPVCACVCEGSEDGGSWRLRAPLEGFNSFLLFLLNQKKGNQDQTQTHTRSTSA